MTKKEAMTWIDKYDKEMRKDKKKDTKSIFFGRDALLKMLSEDGSSGITFFLALRHNEIFKKETVHLVLVPTKEKWGVVWTEGSRLDNTAEIRQLLMITAHRVRLTLKNNLPVL